MLLTDKVQKINVLSQLGGTPSFMMNPPKDHLVEKASVPFLVYSCFSLISDLEIKFYTGGKKILYYVYVLS